jgi:hypothetical protein
MTNPDEANSLQNVQHWCLYIPQKCEFLNDEPRSGRPPINCLDLQILSSLRKQPFHSAYSLPAILNVLLTIILNHLRDSLHLKCFHLRWITHQLTGQLRATRVQKCEELLPLLESMAANKFRTIVMSDESWFTLESQHSAKWSIHREESPERA